MIQVTLVCQRVYHLWAPTSALSIPFTSLIHLLQHLSCANDVLETFEGEIFVVGIEMTVNGKRSW